MNQDLTRRRLALQVSKLQGPPFDLVVVMEFKIATKFKLEIDKVVNVFNELLKLVRFLRGYLLINNTDNI